ncbi:hypothetical protein WN51_09814, partial [Melipona quadrifasciata]
GPIAWPSRSPDLSPLDFFLFFFSMGSSAVNSLCCSNTKYGTFKAANRTACEVRNDSKNDQYKLTT